MGKFSVIYVIGLSAIIVYSLWNINASGVNAGDVYSTYYGRTMVHDIAITGANIGSQALLANPAYSTDLLDQQFAGGSFDMFVTRTSENATITSVAKFELAGQTLYDTVIGVFKNTPFSKYGWFTEKENNGYVGSPYYNASDWKITGDSVYGLAHTNGHFNLAGTPYFNDKVTATTGPVLMKINGVEAPVYASGYEWGVTVNRPIANLTKILNDAIAATSVIDVGDDVALTFIPDGTVGIKIPPATGATRNDTIPLSSIAPTGVLVVRDGDVRITGAYKGQITVAALEGSSSNKGNVWIDGNGIVAADDPMLNPSSTDMMGIVAENMAYITRDDTRTQSSLVTIEAAVYCYDGELTAQDFWTINKSGRVLLYGGVTQKTAGSLGVFNSGGLQHGMFYTIHHDPRFLFDGPPDYPVSDKYELVSWWEN